MSIQNDIRFAFQKKNNAHIQFILINIGIFILINALRIFSSLGNTEFLIEISNKLFTIPANIDDFIFRPWSIITYSFSHEDLMHIVGNMLFLYLSGKVLIDFLGSRRFINIYILGSIGGALLYLLSYNLIPFYIERAQMHPNISMLGASASVNAITVAAATLAPNYAFRLMFIGEVKLKYIALFFIVISFINIDGGNAGGNIAHLGGAGIGYVFIKQLQKGNDLGLFLNNFYNFFGGLFNPSKKVKVTYRKTEKTNSSTPITPTFSKTSQVEIDAILDKIAESGYESLSKTEKDKLFNASKD